MDAALDGRLNPPTDTPVQQLSRDKGEHDDQKDPTDMGRQIRPMVVEPPVQVDR